MSNLTNISNASSGNANVTAKIVGAGNAFQNNCNRFLVEAYQLLMALKVTKITWEEDTFTANFSVLLEDIFDIQEVPYTVTYQQHQLTKKILSGEVRAQTAKKMDIVFGTFSRPKLSYGIEAKIIAELNVGTRNANSLCKEYIVSGIDRFVSGTYSMIGCMVGYVISGQPDNIVIKINDVLTNAKRNDEVVGDKHLIYNHEHCYSSTHKEMKLQHFFFNFN
jgi:hypothetical protein